MPLQVAIELKELEAVLPTTCPLRRLQYLKSAMRSAAELLLELAPPDPMTTTMQVLRRVDRGST